MEKKIEFKSGKNILRGRLFIPRGKGPFPTLIFFHGSGSKGQKYYDAGKVLSKKGFLCMAFNFTGCGESDGDYLRQTHQDAFEDASNALKKLLKQDKVDKTKIGMVGGSFGGYVASMTLPIFDVKSLVLLSPSAHDDSYDTKIEMGSLKKEVDYFKNEYNWIRSEAYFNIERFKNSLLVIRAEKDENIPSVVVERYDQISRSREKKYVILKGADHRLSTEKMRKDFYKLISDWFIKTL